MEKVQIAIIGLGRIGALHALHAAEVSAAQEGCAVSALVDADRARAKRMAQELRREFGVRPSVFEGVGDLLDAGVSNAAIVATPTHLHREHAGTLARAGHRMLLEKPLTDSLQSDREFVRELDVAAPNAVMLGLQRRFDPPLMRAKQLIEEGAIGRPFKVISILEDSSPVPDGYSSPGILQDMSVHNIDEVLWLLDDAPAAAVSIGSNIYSHRLSTADEDFDDAFVQMWFAGGGTAQVQVSRNHVSGYHVETWIFGPDGQIHAGHFDQSRSEVLLEAYGRDRVIEKTTFPLRTYDRPLPEFAGRFGPAYKAEVEEFVRCCRTGEPFPVGHLDGLRAMEVIDAAVRGLISREMAAAVGAPD
jgi:predicted dehydrogenase